MVFWSENYTNSRLPLAADRKRRWHLRRPIIDFDISGNPFALPGRERRERPRSPSGPDEQASPTWPGPGASNQPATCIRSAANPLFRRWLLWASLCLVGPHGGINAGCRPVSDLCVAQPATTPTMLVKEADLIFRLTKHCSHSWASTCALRPASAATACPSTMPAANSTPAQSARPRTWPAACPA